MQASQIPNHQPQVSFTEDAAVRSSSQNRALPGCRSCGLSWDGCSLDLVETGDGLTVSLQLAGQTWSRHLNKDAGQIRCNLQEMEILRWATEKHQTAGAALQHQNYIVSHLPQERYACLFPHADGASHGILEIMPGMSEDDLLQAGEEAIRNEFVMLCPVPRSNCECCSHDGVIEEVHRLAVQWPLRQIVCEPMVEGIIDITPVASCRFDVLRMQDKSDIFEEMEPRSEGVLSRIRTTMTIGQLEGYMGEIPGNSHIEVSPDIAIHDTWVGNIGRIIQPAVLRCMQRRATAQPTRLYDAQTRVTREQRPSVETEHYLALSYCWGEWPEDNEDPLKDKLEALSHRLGIRHFWVDRWCIDQSNEEDKAREIPLLRNYYMGASGCVVLAGPDLKPFECVPRHPGSILSAFQQLRLNSSAILSLLRSKWVTRVWTLQEGLMSRQLIYAVQDQLIDGDYISELAAYIHTCAESYTDHNGRLYWVGGYGCYRWNTTGISVITPRQFRTEEESRQLVVLRTVFGGEQQYNVLQSMAGGVVMPFEEALTLIAGRYSTKQEDYVYGILGISHGGNQIRAQYDISWGTMLDRLHQASMITERQLAAPTVNTLAGMSWLPESGSRYGPFENMEVLAAPICRPVLTRSDQGAIVYGAVFEWIESNFVGWKKNIHGMPCDKMRGKIRFPGTPGLVAQVAATSTPDFSEQRLSGTHVMLCSGVEKSTLDTVVMIVDGDVESGRVYRKNGYVLELHQWIEGDPIQLDGKQWIIGGVPMS